MSKTGHLAVDDELTIHFEESGDGQHVILLLPGWTMSTRVFERQLKYFENSRQFRFITFDPRAHGQSSKTSDGHYYEQHGRDLNAFIDAMELEKIVIGGWSFGTLAVLSYLEQFGADKVSGLIMLDGPPRAAGPDNGNDWVTYSYDDCDGGQEFFTMGKLRDNTATNVEFAKWMLEDQSQESIDWIVEITNQMPDTAASLLNATSVFLDYRRVLEKLNGEVELLYYVRQEKRQMVENWASTHTPDATVRALGKHMMFWERAADFNRDLTDFTNHVLQLAPTD